MITSTVTCRVETLPTVKQEIPEIRWAAFRETQLNTPPVTVRPLKTVAQCSHEAKPGQMRKKALHSSTWSLRMQLARTLVVGTALAFIRQNQQLSWCLASALMCNVAVVRQANVCSPCQKHHSWVT